MNRNAIIAGAVAFAVCASTAVGQTPPAATPGNMPPASAAPPVLGAAALQERLNAMVSDPAVGRAHWGVKVTGLDGTPIASVNEGQLFQPASNTKLYTTAAAMALLGPQATFRTTVQGAGVWEGSQTLTGDLTLIGGGDANLNGRDLPYISRADKLARKAAGEAFPPVDPLARLGELADQVAATGLRTLKGDVIGDDTLWPWEPYGPGWEADDALWYYGAPISALTINDNQLDVLVAPGPNAGEPATVTVTPALPSYYRLDLTGLKTVPHGAPSHVVFDRAIGSRTLRIYGSIAVGAEPDAEGIAIEDPAEFAAAALKYLLQQRGITVTGTIRAKHRAAIEKEGFLTESMKPLPPFDLAQEHAASTKDNCTECRPPSQVRQLAVRNSIPLAEDVSVTNKVSQNQHAEMFLHDLSVAAGDPKETPGSGAEGARVVRQYLVQVGIDPKDFVFYDGSGLSDHDLVTPRATAKLLSYAAHDPKTGEPQPWFAQWRASLPVAGVDGSLAARFKDSPLKNHMFAKTGTLGEARALSGYLDCASGQTVIFSIMVGDFVPSTNAARDTLDRMVAVIAAAL